MKTTNTMKTQRMQFCKYICACLLGVLTGFGIVSMSNIVHASSGPINPMTSLKSVYKAWLIRKPGVLIPG